MLSSLNKDITIIIIIIIIIIITTVFRNLLYASFSGLITSVGEERAIFCYRLLVIMWFLFGGLSSSSSYLG